MLRKLLILFTLLGIIPVSYAESVEPCNKWFNFFKPACLRVHSIWTQGNTDLYLSGYAWHNRFTYDANRIPRYNELAWGGGLGKGLFDEKGDWHGLYAFAFLDSHKNVEPIAGYAFLKIHHFNDNFSVGGGASVFITARPDIFHNIPFPGMLPWGAITYRRFTLSFTYIPGTSNVGNVLFLVTRWAL